ncbi:FHA domain-containing protein [Teredinibacter turnerae]|uniref:FHA domain-containing protein n=1 Tax=Teredinibacter turnerae TaxID=2426 RepID=UPI00036A730E|nr:FHA domain-containing protein [Teredinibacter turnerae]
MATLAQLVDDVVVHKFEVASTDVALGRHPENTVTIDDSAVSSHHAKITQQPNEYFPEYIEYFIEDCGSTNGTYINDLRIQGKKRLHNNDIVRLAWNRFKFLDEKESDMEKTVQMLNKTI